MEDEVDRSNTSSYSLYDQFFEITLLLCDRFHTLDPLIIREKDAEEVIIMMSRFISLGSAKHSSNPQKDINVVKTEKGIVKRKKVFADTAKGGWY